MAPQMYMYMYRKAAYHMLLLGREKGPRTEPRPGYRTRWPQGCLPGHRPAVVSHPGSRTGVLSHPPARSVCAAAGAARPAGDGGVNTAPTENETRASTLTHLHIPNDHLAVLGS